MDDRILVFHPGYWKHICHAWDVEFVEGQEEYRVHGFRIIMSETIAHNEMRRSFDAHVDQVIIKGMTDD